MEQTDGRTVLWFCNDWKFARGDCPDGQEPSFDDRKFRYVNLPHSTVLYTPEQYNQVDQDVFWYRKHFSLPEAKNRRVRLTFDGAMQEARVWLNGRLLGTHQGGYTAFSFDLTGKLLKGDNVLAVRLDTRPDEAFAPGKVNPDFQYFGGLYRQVWLTLTGNVHVTDPLSGGGVFLTAPAVTEKAAVVKAVTELCNAGAQPVLTAVTTELLNPDGTAAGKESTVCPLQPGEKRKVVQELTVQTPRLWSTDAPELYLVRTTVNRDGTVCDQLETTYGIRRLQWKRDGCYLNGKRVELRGVNLHQETYLLGSAMPDNAIDAEIRRLRQWGFNMVRMSHYPHGPAFYDACDRYGVAVMDCLAGWQFFSRAPEFVESTRLQLQEMVRQHRNHPSIVVWEASLNESGFDRDWAQMAHETVHREYPTEGDSRPWTGGWLHWDVYDLGVGTPQADVVPDAAACGKPVIVSEYGDWNLGGFASSSRVTREPAVTPEAGGERGMLIQCDNVQSSMACNRRQSWYGAGAYWQYADYAGFDAQGLTTCGVVDVARIPKFAAWFVRSQQDPARDPMVYIANLWTKQSPRQVRVFSNCDQVELWLEDRLVARQAPDTEIWDPRGAYPDTDGSSYPTADSGCLRSAADLAHPPFTFVLPEGTPGCGTLRAVGLSHGVPCAEYVRRAPGKAERLVLQPENTQPLRLDGSSARLIWIDAVDAAGTVVPDAHPVVSCAAEGPGLVIGDKQVRLRGGQWAIWIRSRRGSGPIAVTVKAEGLTPAALVLQTEEMAGLPPVPAGGDADESDWLMGKTDAAGQRTRMDYRAAAAVSSSAPASCAAFGNDGNPRTFWVPAPEDPAPWWQLDGGGLFTGGVLTLNWSSRGAHRYRVEASADGQTWTQLVSRWERGVPGGSTEETWTEALRYLRICPAPGSTDGFWVNILAKPTK